MNAETIRALHEGAQTGWPGVVVPADVFAKALLARAQAASVDVSALAHADLYLALGCAAGDRVALRAFEEQVVSECGRALARLRLGASAVDDILQRLRTKLLVGDGRGPLVASYAARGSLVAWARAVAVHEALSDKRKDARRPLEGPSAIEHLAFSADDPEVARMRQMYAEPFRVAFAEALASLAPRDRNVLKLVYVDGLTAEQVGLAYGAHRVSVARWLGQIRESLFERTRALLLPRLHMSAGELHSLTRMCLSQIDVSMERLLADPKTP